MFDYNNENEIELIAKAKACDGNAFGKLVTRYIPKLRRHIGRRVYEPENIDDVLQQTLLKVWQGLKGFEGRSQLSTWLYRIAENAANTYLQQRKNRLGHEISISHLSSDGNTDWDGLAQVGHLDTPDGRLEEKQRLELLLNADKRLPPEMAETYRLRYWEELSYKEIAQQQGIPIGTVRSRISRARTAFERPHKEDKV